MCGILGYISKENKDVNIVTEGLQRLRGQGYDSAGMLSFQNNEFITTKYANNEEKGIDSVVELIQRAEQVHRNSKLCIAHTRWSNIGQVNTVNAHPHFDLKNRIGIFHNGKITNYQQLLQSLQQMGITPQSETDSELIAILIGLQMDNGRSFYEATKKVIKEQITGNWSLVIIHKDFPYKAIVANKGSQLYVSWDYNTIYISSDEKCLEQFSTNYYSLNENEILELNVNHTENFLEKVLTKSENTISILTREKTKPILEWDHYHLQEIMEQPLDIQKCLNDGARLGIDEEGCPRLGGLEKYKKEISEIDNIVIVAEGFLIGAALFAAKYFKQLKAFNSVFVVDASEFEESDFPKQKAGFIFLSVTGEEESIYRVVKECTRKGVFRIGVSETVGSTIAQNLECGIYTNILPEYSRSLSKSFTCQSISLILIALWVSSIKQTKEQLQRRIEIIDNLHTFSLMAGKILYYYKDKLDNIVDNIKDSKSLFILGKGASSAIARVGALAFKQLTKIHTEGYAAGELKHGSIALIDPDNKYTTKFFVIILNDEYLHDMLLALSEIRARYAYTVVITDCPEKITKQNADHILEIESLSHLTPLLTIFPLQLIAYYVAIAKGENPDL